MKAYTQYGTTVQATDNFNQVLSIAVRTARVLVAQELRHGTIVSADQDDVVQESLIHGWRALSKFDPNRASLSTFVQLVIARRIASIRRSARNRPRLEEIDPSIWSNDEINAARCDLRVDVRRLLLRLDYADRKLALLLMQYTPAESARRMGIARSTVYERIARLRRHFSVLKPSGRSIRISRRRLEDR